MTKSEKNAIIGISALVVIIIIVLLFVHHRKAQRVTQNTNGVPQAEQAIENNYSNMKNANTNNQQKKTLLVYQGKPIIHKPYVTIPFAIQNESNNTVFFDTQEISMFVPHTVQTIQHHFFFNKKIDKTKNYQFLMYNPASQSTEYTMSLKNGDELQTFYTFKFDSPVTASDCQKARIVYQAPSGKNYMANMLPKDPPPQTIKTQLSSLNNLTTIGSYFNNIRSMQSQANGSNQSLQKIAKQNTGDEHYLDFYMNVYQLTNNNQEVLLAINNQTASDMALNLQNIELYDDTQEVLPQLDLINFSLFIPHNLHTYMLLPLQSPLITNGTYTVRFKSENTSNSGNNANSQNFQATKNLPHPVKFHSNNQQVV